MDAEQWDERYRARDVAWGAEPNRFVVEAVGGLTPGTALDLACGEGRNAVWLAGLGWSVVGIDWSEVALGRAAERAVEAGVDVEWRREDLFAWEPAAERFDLVMIVYLQVPGQERAMVWQRAAAAVAPGGRLVVIGHDSRNLEDGVGGPSSPEVLYRAEEVTAVVGGSLEVVEAATVLRPVEIDGVRHEAIDNRVVAVRRPR